MEEATGKNMLNFIEWLEESEMISYGYFDRQPKNFFPLTHRSLEEDISLEDLADRIGISLCYQGTENIAQLYLDAPRLLRTITDSALGSNHPLEYAAIKGLATEFCHEIFSFDFYGAKRTLDLIISDNLFKENISNEIMEISDGVTWNACDSYKIRSLESALKGHYPDADTIVISGHGGYRGGFLLATQLGIKPYTARNSGHKHKDIAINIIDPEMAKERINGKNVIAFDEDISSGTGLNRLIESIKSFEPKSIMGATLKFVCEIRGEFAINSPAIFPITDKYLSNAVESQLENKLPLLLRDIAIYSGSKKDGFKTKKKHCLINDHDYGDY